MDDCFTHVRVFQVGAVLQATADDSTTSVDGGTFSVQSYNTAMSVYPASFLLCTACSAWMLIHPPAPKQREHDSHQEDALSSSDRAPAPTDTVELDVPVQDEFQSM